MSKPTALSGDGHTAKELTEILMLREDILQLISRSEETDPSRDSIGNFESQYCDRRWESPLYYPIINEELSRRDQTWLQTITWPHGKTFAACLTHDVDTVQINSRRELIRTIRLHMKYAKNTSEWIHHASSVTALRRHPLNIDIFTPWIELEKRFGFHSTFFFFGTKITQRYVSDMTYKWNDTVSYKGEKCVLKEVVRDIHSQGWYVGLHGSILSARNESLLSEQKEDLEEILGGQVYSIRQHNLQYDAQITPFLHEKVGFHVDSTLGFNRDVGFRAGIAYPFRIYDPNENRYLGIFQIPLVLQDGALMRQDNLDLNELEAIRLGKKLIDRVRRTKGVITLLWHPNAIIESSWSNVYEKLLEYIHEQNGWGASAKEIRDWWLGQGLSAKMEKLLENIPLGKSSASSGNQTPYGRL